ncbi:MAG: DEAD/DEAH box helicase [Promethearchaeota archaeon]
MAIPIVLKGKNLLLSAATASGKTEAIVAPLIERLFKENWQGLSIIYISPTRALVNDLELRFKDIFKGLNVSLSVKTGDRPLFNPKKPTQFLITTPESLDSLICRNPKTLKNIRAVVLDEIHLLEGTYRGDQLRILLRRLKEISNHNFNIYILSATISNSSELGKRYTENFEIIKLKQKREIYYSLINSIDDLLKFIRKEKIKKILVFCNSRKKVEELANKWKELKLPFEVFAHHGSLSRTYRESTEKFIKRNKYIICFATTSLEIGIDIGDIDAVVLADLPWSVSTLLQRIGRGNRRELINRVFAIYENNIDLKTLFIEMFELAINGKLENKKYSPDLSVVIQQIFSCLFANPSGLSFKYFNTLFQGFCSENNLKSILLNLNSLDYIEFKRDKWFATEKLMNLGRIGMIHSNIPDDSSMPVFDIASNKKIGNVSFPIDNVFILGGKKWKVIKIEPKRIIVRRDCSKAYSPEFELRSKMGKYFYLLPDHLKVYHKIE